MTLDKCWELFRSYSLLRARSRCHDLEIPYKGTEKEVSGELNTLHSKWSALQDTGHETVKYE